VAPTFASDEEFSDDEVEFVAETDAERRQALLTSEQDDNHRQKLGSESSWTQFENDFNFSAQNTAGGSKGMFNDAIDILSDDGDDDESCALPVASGSTSVMEPPRHPSRADKDKLKAVESRGGLGQKSTGRGSSLNPLGLGNIVQTEINFRKKESLGLAPIKGGGRTLGSKFKSKPVSREERSPSALEPPVAKLFGEHLWICLVCTL
jgi:DNA-dependent metalloprotease WSS1